MRIMKQDLLEILVDIFKSSGYSVTISNPCDILVEKNGHKAFVRCTLQPDYREIKAFSDEIDNSTGIYVITQKTTGELNDYAAELGVYVWDRDELALQIGRAVLANMERKETVPLQDSETPEKVEEEVPAHFNEVPGDLTMDSGEAENESPILRTDFSNGLVPLQEMQAEEEKTYFVPGSAPKTPEERNPSKKHEHIEVPKVDSYDILNIKSVEPGISKEQAIIIAKPYLSNPKDAILKFVPFWKYSYNVESEKRFRSKVLSITGEGKGFLNALNKTKEDIELEGLESPTRIPAVVYEVKRTNVNKQQAEKLLLDEIIEENTREMRFNNTEGQAIVYEQRSVKPKHEDIELELELVYIPVWEVKGKRNSLEINAYNAEVLEAPVDEDAEFV
ncbi:MAG: hypothetical protein AB3K77_17185 [Methanosarcinaceae archaeon]